MFKKFITALRNLTQLYTYDIGDVPFVPDKVEGHPILCIHHGKAICG